MVRATHRKMDQPPEARPGAVNDAAAGAPEAPRGPIRIACTYGTSRLPARHPPRLTSGGGKRPKPGRIRAAATRRRVRGPAPQTRPQPIRHSHQEEFAMPTDFYEPSKHLSDYY